MLKKLELYIDTSVIGGVLDSEDKRRLEITKNFLNLVKKRKVIGYVSNITLEEINKAPPEIKKELLRVVQETKPDVLQENEECIKLVEFYLKEKIIPPKFRDDLRHIAIAVVYGLDAVVSWNFKHIVNIITKRKVNSVNLKLGFKTIDLISPEEVTYG